MRTISGVLTVLLALIAGSLNASALERILNFDSKITVEKNGSVQVKETITVRGERHKIKRGIYRDFPIRYRSKEGRSRWVVFNIGQVKRDGKPEPHFSKIIGDYKRLYIGEENTFLPSGEFVYEISYVSTRRLRFLEGFDELYWNVTGDEWLFQIDKASVIVTLPMGAKILRKRAFTGRFGQTGNDYTKSTLADNVVRFDTTRRLDRREGLTIAIGWQKGITEPFNSGVPKQKFLRLKMELPNK